MQVNQAYNATLPIPPPPPFIVCKCYVQVHHFGGKDNYLYFAL